MTSYAPRKSQVITFMLCMAPTLVLAQQTTPSDRQAFLDKYSGVSTAMGVASFCNNKQNTESLKALLVSSAADSNLHRGKDMYDAVRELMEPVFAHMSGVAAGLEASRISGSSKETVCHEGAEAAIRMATPRKP
jgi:hypothetical protein